MKLLSDISREKYNDVNFCLEYLRNNPNIGNEDAEPIEYFHCFWKGKLTDLHLMNLKSLHDTHPNARIFLWTSDEFEVQGSSSWIKIRKLLKGKIRTFKIEKQHFIEANAESLYSTYIILTFNQPDHRIYNHNIAYASDIVRFIVLYIYGGVWFDNDVLFLRNLDSIKLKRYVSQWGTDMCGNAALMRLEKGHDLIKKCLRFEKPFYPTTSFQLQNDLDLTILPSTFFDILWRPREDIPNTLQFIEFDDFFKQTELNLPKEIYTYHWHNRWRNSPPPFYKYE